MEALYHLNLKEVNSHQQNSVAQSSVTKPESVASSARNSSIVQPDDLFKGLNRSQEEKDAIEKEKAVFLSKHV